MQLPKPTGGSVIYDGQDLTKLKRPRPAPSSGPQMQMIFQDPISSLNPRRKVGDIVAEPLRIWKPGQRRASSARSSTRRSRRSASTPRPSVDRRPHQFSGGQCQRICIARSLVLDPKLIICDEPVSALDVSVQAQILNLLEDMKERYGLTLVFIAHDLAVVKNISDRVAVMYLGKLCEVAKPDDLYAKPAHPYTAALLALDPGARSGREGHGERRPGRRAALPRSRRRAAAGSAPAAPGPRTCAPRSSPRCTRSASGHYVACHFPSTSSRAPAARRRASELRAG